MVTSLPDSEILVRTWALSKTSITDLIGTRVATNLPIEPTLPFLVITLLGGAVDDSEALIGRADFQFDAYAGNWGGDNTKNKPDYGTAFSIANKVMQEAFAQKTNSYTSDGGSTGVIYGFTVTSNVRRIDEEGIGLARYNFDATMTYRSLNDS